MAEVILESVRKLFPGNVVAVDTLDLHVADGEFLVLVGPSGCGKTTTLRMIAGLEEMTSGTIRIGDRVVNRVHPKDRDVAMVFQEYALYPHMTVRRNLSFALMLRKTPRAEIERRVARAADLLGIADLLGRRPAALSGGQQQRVALGRAIVREPNCYLLDEPLSNLDAALRLQMRAELKALHLRLKTTTIYVTHDQEEAMTLGDRLVVMAGGVVQQVGAPLEVYRKPANRFVAGFLGSPPMNFVVGGVEVGGNGGRVFTDGGGVTVPVESADVEGPIVLGVPPEQLRLSQDSAPATNAGSIEGRVEVVEPLGDRVDVHVTTAGGVRVVARLDADLACEPGEEVRFVVDPRAVHLFEPGAFGCRV